MIKKTRKIARNIFLTRLWPVIDSFLSNAFEKNHFGIIFEKARKIKI